ncbi:response regulator [Acidobacterium sp. S8]|uniref:response regulator n=1 Tax=Acidobacterium sp. S8 TaxID=1641854 RepID=UPI0020B1098B|nr:response regulator [Acidobacterium sp. S8]
MRMARVLIIDDDVELCRLLAERLSTEDFSIEAIHNGQQGLERALSHDYALVILDLMLPGMKGLDVLRHLRERSTVPVLILTARGEDVDRILGLEIGADDYLPKPFNPRELIARIHAILRRTHYTKNAAVSLVVDDIRLDSTAREAWINKTQLDLTSVEFSLLETLLHHAGHVVTREHLTEVVLGRKLGPFDRVIDVHISNVRRKLTHAADAGERIKAVRGSGYLLIVRSEVT